MDALITRFWLKVLLTQQMEVVFDRYTDLFDNRFYIIFGKKSKLKIGDLIVFWASDLEGERLVYFVEVKYLNPSHVINSETSKDNNNHGFVFGPIQNIGVFDYEMFLRCLICNALTEGSLKELTREEWSNLVEH